MEIYCLICNKSLELLGGDNINFPPNEAVAFSSCGNYGSSVFDMGDFYGERLEIYICDQCLVGKAHKVIHVKKSVVEQSEFIVNKFIDVR